MKNLCARTFILLLTVCCSSLGLAQVAIGTGAAAPSPDPSAVLLLVGNGSQGMIIPKVSSLGTFGKEGMVVYNTATGTVHYFSTIWNQLGTGGAGSQGIQISGNKVLIGSGAGFSTEFSIANTAPGANGQILMWDTSLNAGAGGWTSSAATAPSAIGQVLKWNGSRWEPGTDNVGSTTALSGDVSGPSNNTTISNAAGNSIAAALNNAATTSKILPAQISSGAAGQVLTTTGGVAVWSAPTGGALPSLSANQLLSNNGTNAGITVAGDVGLSVTGTTGTFTIAPNAITDSKVATGISASKITTGTLPIPQVPNLDAAKITTGTFTTAQIPNLDAAKITTGTISTARLDVGTTANKIVQVDGTGKLPAIDGSQLTNLPTGSVTDGSITGGTAGAGVKIAANTITDANINSLDAAKITSGTLPIARIAAGSVDNTKLASGIDAAKITTGTLPTARLDVGTTANKIVQVDGTGKLPAIDGSQLTNLPTGSVTDGSITGGTAGAGVKIASNTITDANINSLDAAKITSGTLPIARIAAGTVDNTKLAAGIDAAKITTGTLPVSQVPNLDATKITTGTISTARLDVGTTANKIVQLDGTAKLPAIDGSQLTNLPTGSVTDGSITGGTAGAGVKIAANTITDANILSLDAAKITSGTLPIARIAAGDVDNTKLAAGIDAAKITTGTLPVAQVPNLDATKITTGTMPIARGGTGLSTTPTNGQLLIGNGTSFAAATLTNGTGINVTNGAGTITVAANAGTGANQLVQLDGTAKLPAIDGSQLINLPTGSVTDGSITGGTAGAGVKIAANTITDANINSLDAAKITSGTMPIARIAAGSVDNTKLASGIDAAKITTGTLPVAQVPGLDASKIISGTFTATQIPGLDASKITSGTFTSALIPNLDANKITTGTLPVAVGGTGASTLSGLVVGNGASPFTAVATGANGQILTVSGGNPTWQNVPAPSGSAGGDLLGSTYPNPVIAAGAINSTKLATDAVNTINITNLAVTDAKINDVAPSKITAGGATTGQVLKFNGTNWVAQADNVGGGGAPTLNVGQVIVGDGTSNSAATVGLDATLALNGNITVQGLRGRLIDPAAPATNSVYQYDGTKWVPVVLAGGGTVTSITAGTGLTGGIISSSGTIGLAAGGVGTTQLANNAVTAAILSSDGSIDANRAVTTNHVRDAAITDAKLASGITVSKLTPGTNGQVLTTTGGVTTWQTSAALTNPMTTLGDIISGGVAGVPSRLGVGANGQILTVSGGVPTWQNAAGASTLDALTDVTAAGATDAQILIKNGAGDFTNRSLSGDISITNLGAATIANNAVTNVKIATGIDATKITTGTLPTAQVPNLDASKITTGTLPNARLNVGITANQLVQLDGTSRLPAVDGSQLINLPAGTVADGSITGGTAGAGVKIAANTITDANILSLDAAKITSGTLPIARIAAGAVDNTKLATGIDAAKITTGTLPTAQVPNLDATKITTGTFVTAQIPNLDANKITTGTLPVARGGSGITAVTQGGVAYGGATNFAFSAAGTTGQLLQSNGTAAPTWVNAPATSTASNGITKTANDFALGGTLTGATTIANGGFDLNVTGAGKVGIGNTTPAAKLDVVTTTGTSIAGTTSGNAAQNYAVSGIHSGTGDAAGFFLNTNPATAFPAMYAESRGTNSVGVMGTIGTTGTGHGAIFQNFNPTNTASVIYISTAGSGPSIITDQAVGIGNPSPTERLDVTGNVKFSGSLMPNGSSGLVGQVLTSAGPGSPPTWAGGSGWGLTGNAGTVDGTNFIGTTDNIPLNFKVNNQKAGRIDQSLSGSTYLGWLSGNVSTGGQNAAFGSQAMEKNTAGGANAAFGQLALNNNTTGLYNVAVGAISMTSNTTGGNNIAIGVQANNNNTIGSGNTAIGYNANYANVSSGFNTIVGIDAGFNNTGANNTGIGRRALFNNTTGSNNTALGYQADVGATFTNATAIGANASATASNTIQLGDLNITTVNVGTGTTAKLVAGQLQVTGGTLGAGRVLTSDASGNATWQLASSSGWGLTGNAGTNPATNFIGTTDSQPLKFKVNNLNAGLVDLTDNSFFGLQAGDNNTGFSNIAIGARALSTANSGLYNIAIGRTALADNTTGNLNVALGENALSTNQTGTKNTVVGAGANVQSTNLNNATAIGFNARVATSNSLVLGGTGADAVNVGINTTSPTERLDVVGNLKFSGALMPNNTAGTSGQVLTSAGAGLPPTWTTVGGGGNMISTNNLSDVANVATSRTNLGLGALATLAAVSGGAAGTITDLTIDNNDISATAAIAGTKIAPAFGTQAISTTGTLSSGAATVTGLTVSGTTTILNTVPYTWPAVQGGAGTVLTNNGSGTVTWGAAGLTNPMTTTGDIIYATGTVPTRLAGAAGVLKSTGAAAPTWGAVNLASADVTGTLPIAQGGTNSTATPTNGGVGYGTGTGHAYSAAGTSGQLLQSNGAAAPTWVTIPAFLSPTLTNGNIFVGNGSNVATGVAMSGDATISNTGALTLANSAGTRTNLGLGVLATLAAVSGGVAGTITDLTIDNNDISATAAIAGTKIAPAFGTQAISTTGTLSSGAATVTGLTVSGTTTTINTVGYTWPAVQGGAGTVLTNNGSGTVTWGAAGLSNPLTTNGDIIYGVGSTPTRLAAGTGFLRGGAVPSYSSINLATVDVSGTLPVANGGTGLSTFGGAGLLYASGATTMGNISNGSAGQMLLVTGSTPTWQTMGGDATINGTGALTIAAGAISGGTGGDITDATITAADLAVGAVDLTTTDVTGILPIGQGGTNSSAAATNGGVGYGTGTAHAYSVAGTSGQLLQSNGAAAPTWVNAPAAGWGLTGNAGTNPATNFIGTSDPQDLVFKTAGSERMRLLSNGTSTMSSSVNGVGLTFTNTGVGASVTEGIRSSASGSTLNNYGIHGIGNGSINSYGVVGEGQSGSNGTAGVVGIGQGTGSTNIGVIGQAITAATENRGLYASSGNGITNYGLFSQASGTGTNYAVYGDAFGGTTNWAGFFNNGNVHIKNALSVGATPGTFGTSGQVLTSAGAGVAPTWANAAGWGLTGNATTVDGTNFIGTTDNIPLNFRMNNLKAGRIASSVAFFGLEAGNSNTGTNNTALGGSALKANTAGTDNTAVGFKVMENGNSSRNTGIGSYALNAGGSNDNTAIGFESLLSTLNSGNTAVGSGALRNNTSGSGNAFGNGALTSNTTGINNVAMGTSALTNNISGNFNVAIGNNSLNFNTSSSNTAVGNNSGTSNSNGNSNTFIGANANSTGGFKQNATAIGAQAYVTASNSLVLGAINGVNSATSDTNVGIGTTAPTAKLDIVGNIKITDGTQGVGKILTSDANGLATWSGTPSFWGINGNALGNLVTGKLGSTDNSIISIVTNDTERMRIDNFGNIGIQQRLAIGNTYYSQTPPVNGAIIEGNVGIGTNNPITNKLFVSVPSTDATNPVALRIDNNYTGGSSKFGIDVNVDGAGSGSKYGISSSVVGLGGDASSVFGYQVAMTPNGTGTSYGLYSTTSSVGTGTRYGVYSTTSSNSGNASSLIGTFSSVSHAGTGNSYAIYGNNLSTGTGTDYGVYMTGEDQSYFSGQVGIGILSPTKKLHVVKSPIALYDGAIVGSSSATDNSGFFGAMAYDSGPTNFGVYAHSDALANTSPLGVNRAADGALVSFMSAGSVEGSITVSGTTVSYGAFTGVHYAQMENEKVERGMLVSLNGKNGNLHNKKTSEQVYGINKTAVPNDSKVMGTYLGLMDPSLGKSADNPIQIMAVGNGDMWVVDNGKDLEVGDYLISSDLAGYAMLDKGEYDVAHVIARVGQNVNWDEVKETLEGRKVMNVSIFFENFEINHKAKKLMAEIELLNSKVTSMKEKQDTEIAALKKQMEEVMRIVGAEAKKKD